MGGIDAHTTAEPHEVSQSLYGSELAASDIA